MQKTQPCDLCGESIRAEARFCEFCGTQQGSAAQRRAAARSETRKNGESSGEKVAKVLVGGVGVLIVAWMFWTFFGPGGVRLTPRDRSLAAVIHCQLLVEERLQFPNTAEFRLFSDYSVHRGGEGNATYIMTSSVLSGLVTRENTYFTCQLRYLGGDESERSSWQVLSVVVR